MPCRLSRATAWQRPRWCPWFSSCPSSTVGRWCRSSTLPRWCPSCRSTAGRSCRSSRATAWQAGAAPVPRRAVVSRCRSPAGRWCPSCRADHPGPRPGNGRGGARGFRHAHHRRWEGRADHRPCRGGVRRADRRREGGARRADRRWEVGADHPGPRPGKLVPRRSPVVPSCRSTAGRSCRADRRREAGARHAAPPCRSSTVPRWCPSCRSTAGKLVPIIQGHGLATAAVVPVVSVMPIIDGGKVVPVVPRCRSTAGKVVPVMPRRRAHHPGPRPGNGRGGARGFRHAHHRRREGRAVPPCRSTAGSWCPSCRGADRQPGSWCPSCRADRRREGRAHHPGPRLATAAVVSVVPIIQGHGLASWCRAGPPSCRSTPVRSCRAAVPIIDLAAVVPVVPIDSREAGARRAVPIDSREGRAHHPGPRPGKPVPRWSPVVPSCRSTPARSCRAAVPIIDLAAVVPVVPIIDGGKVVPCRRADRRREAGARRAVPPFRSSTLPRWCPSYRSTAGKVVPTIQGHGLASWCRAGPPSCRRAVVSIDAGNVVPVMPIIDGGKVVPIIQGHGSQRPRWCPWFPSCPSSTVGRSCRRADGGKLVPVMPRRRADHPGPRPGKLVPRRSPVVPSCQSSTAGRSCRAVVSIDAGKVVPIDGGKVVPPCRLSTLPRWCPSCRSTAGKLVPIIQGHGLASWCRAGPPSCRRAHHRRREGRARRAKGQVTELAPIKLPFVPIPPTATAWTGWPDHRPANRFHCRRKHFVSQRGKDNASASAAAMRSRQAQQHRRRTK